MNNDNLTRTPLKNLKTVECSGCSSQRFEMQYRLKELPALLSPTGQKEFIAAPIYVCAICGQEQKLQSDDNKAPDTKN